MNIQTASITPSCSKSAMNCLIFSAGGAVFTIFQFLSRTHCQLFLVRTALLGTLAHPSCPLDGTHCHSESDRRGRRHPLHGEEEQQRAVMTAAATATAAARPATPRPTSSASSYGAIFDSELRKPAQSRAPLLPTKTLIDSTSSAVAATATTTAADGSFKRRCRRLSIGESKASLPAEAEALKQHILRKWPVPLFRFRLRSMRRVVVSPVPIPSDLANERAWAAMVSGTQIPLTRHMHERQKSRLLDVRVPDTIDERSASVFS